MDQVSTLERLFRYKAAANGDILAAMRHFADASPAREIAIRVLSHTYVVDRIFAANLTGGEHGYTAANLSRAPSLEELSAAIETSDQWYIDYVSRLDGTQLAERIDFAFTDGEPGRMSREEMLLHVTMHGGSHRGQVGWLMMENSITPPADDRFTSYLHSAEATTRRRAATPPKNDFAGGRSNNLRPASHAADERAANAGNARAPLDELTESMKTAVGTAPGLGKTLKFDLKGDGLIYLDSGVVTNEDKPAELTLTVSLEDLKAISQGQLAPITAMMSGRLSLSDMGLAAGLQGKLQALFARMRSAC
jgi:uncharacterized damage-inducible protein DinB/putative sterol carrier protein